MTPGYDYMYVPYSPPTATAPPRRDNRIWASVLCIDSTSRKAACMSALQAVWIHSEVCAPKVDPALIQLGHSPIGIFAGSGLLVKCTAFKRHKMRALSAPPPPRMCRARLHICHPHGLNSSTRFHH